MKNTRWIPSFITLLNLCCGVLAISISDLFLSGLLILTGGFLDLFDGLTARLLNASSEFGKELDSLADVITFGLAPAFLYFMIRPDDNWYLYLPILLISAGAALRLAKFNVESGDHSYFLGMATPSSAFMIIGVVTAIYFKDDIIIGLFQSPYIYIGFAIIIFSLNLIPLRMFSVKSLKSHKVAYYLFIVLILFFISGIFLFPGQVLLYTFILYIVLSLFFHFRTA